MERRRSAALHLSAGVKVSQAAGYLEGVADLAAVPAAAAIVAAELVGGELEDLGLVDLQREQLVIALVALDLDGVEAGDVHLPDLECLLELERWVVELQVDSRLEGFVEGADAVGGEKEEAVVVL